MRIVLEKKFTEVHLDEFVHKIHQNFKINPTDSYTVDLSEVEYIANQELLVLSSIFKIFIDAGISFYFEFFKPGISTNDLSPRVKKQLIQIWDVWKIWKIVPNRDYLKYFNVDGNSIQRLSRELNYSPKASEIFDRYGVTPFQNFDFINAYNAIDVRSLITPIYELNKAISSLLSISNCSHPFTSSSLSTIITEELFINFLDHSQVSSFHGCANSAFMSISLKNKLAGTSADAQIQAIKRNNFLTEELPETESFHFDKKANRYKNIPYIEFSFLDFGVGIANSLRGANDVEDYFPDSQDSNILLHALKHTSSRHLLNLDNSESLNIPRGLFDVWTVTRRYRGMLILRSNFGKIAVDFSTDEDNPNIQTFLQKKKLYFPGTLVSIYLPAYHGEAKLDTSAITPQLQFNKIQSKNVKFHSFRNIVKGIGREKENLYSNLISGIREAISANGDPSLNYISFEGSENIESRIVKKAVYLLLTDYEVNHYNNVVIVDLFNDGLLDQIEEEISNLSQVFKNYKIHPVPILNFDIGKDKLGVRWLGVYQDNDRQQLLQLLYDDFSLTNSDFVEPHNLSGHLNTFDRYGNLHTNFPSEFEFRSVYDKLHTESTEILVSQLLDEYDCIFNDDQKRIYLCTGNYYQREYIELSNLMSNRSDADLIAKSLLKRIRLKFGACVKLKFIGISAASQKILRVLENLNELSENDYYIFDGFNAFREEISKDYFDDSYEYILVCDVLSTGFITDKLSDVLADFGVPLKAVAAIVNTLDSVFPGTDQFVKKYSDKLTWLYSYPIKKFRKKDILPEIFEKEITRVNPYTNIPVSLSIEETSFDETVIFRSKVLDSASQDDILIENRFLDSIDPEGIKVGFYKFNNLIHPYFFETKRILRDLDKGLMFDIFNRINKPALNTERLVLFYPSKSGIQYFNVDNLKFVLNNHAIEEVELERFGTPEGWRFPHNSNYLYNKVDENICLLLDDGSCSGDSLVQMINEISLYSAKEIILLTFVGRVNDIKREFFSRISNFKVKGNKVVPISIFFVSHWHIPTYYLDENPNSKEKAWLNDVVLLPNTPAYIKNISRSVLDALTPKSDISYRDYKYLPKFRDTKQVPKKEILIIREELGKAIGYRLYTENFRFFDRLFKKYAYKRPSKDRYKEMELLCATFIYEPYLFKKIVGVLPDITEQIREFVRVMIFSNEKIYDSLTYEWDKKDIVHLFFIVFQDGDLVKELTSKNFNDLINFTQPKESALNYTLYKLLVYFPLNPESFNTKKHDLDLKKQIYELKDNSPKSKELRRYYNFIASLPTRSDFRSQLNSLRDNYDNQRSPNVHDEKTSFNHNVSLIIAQITNLRILLDADQVSFEDKIRDVRDTWFSMLDFINPILSFSIAFKDFLIPYPYFKQMNKFEGSENSLRQMVGQNDEIIFRLDNKVLEALRLEKLERNIIQIQNFIEIGSEFQQLVESPSVTLASFIASLEFSLRSIGKNLTIHGDEIPEGFFIFVPQLYMDMLLKTELITNFKNHASNENNLIEVKYSYMSDEMFQIIFSNEINKVSYKESNGEGIKCLNLLSSFSQFGFSYQYQKDGDVFIQTIQFKIQ